MNCRKRQLLETYPGEVEGRGNFLSSYGEENESYCHQDDGEKVENVVPFSLNKNPAYHYGNELAALEDDLRGVVQVTHRRVRTTHCCHSEKGQEGVG